MLQIVVLLALTGWALVQNLLYLSYLPERVAIHFGADGVANNWLDRGTATWLMIAIQGGLPWMLIIVSLSIRYVPATLVNIPHREYWLHPERREATLAYVAGLVSSIAILESVFISLVNHMAFTANINGQTLNTQLLLLALVVFLIATSVLVIRMYMRFTSINLLSENSLTKD